jgi:hypothetical protein
VTLTARIVTEGTQVLVQFNDGAKSFVLQLEHQAAHEIGVGMVCAARKAEEWANAERIALDSAILMRSGAPFTLSDHPTIIAEAAKEAAWNTNLRRCMAGGVKSQEAFGLPTILQSPPRRKPS